MIGDDEDLNNLDGSRIPILENGILYIPGKIDNRPINIGASWIIRNENGHKQKYLLSKYCNGKHHFMIYEKVQYVQKELKRALF